MDELEQDGGEWSPEEEWHPMFRAHMDQIRWRCKRGVGTIQYLSWLDYTDYWERQRGELPDVWR